MNLRITIKPEILKLVEKHCGDTPALRMLSEKDWVVDNRAPHDVQQGIEAALEDIAGLIGIIDRQSQSIQVTDKSMQITVVVSCLKIICERLGKFRKSA